LILGLVLSLFGVLVTVSGSFFHEIRKSIWKPRKIDQQILTVEGEKSYSRFQGYMSLIVGIVFLAIWFHVRFFN
jgi:hypothetical protein